MRFSCSWVLILWLLLPSCTISDLRPPELRTLDSNVEREQRGRELLASALEASGGRRAWQALASAELELRDEWHGLLGFLFRPWPTNPTRLQVEYSLGASAAQGEFLEGSHLGEVWGREGDRTWSREPGTARVDGEREAVRFIFAAYQYFFELPLRISEAPIVLYAGSLEHEGRRYERVFATWGQVEPHKEHDQYLLWIATDSGRIEIVQYTIRDKFDFATGVNFFADFRQVQGLVLPHSYRIAQELEDESFVHEVQLENIRLLPRDGPPLP